MEQFIQSKISLKFSFLIVFGVAVLFCLVLNSSIDGSNIKIASVIGQENPNLPVHLKIPSINIDANVEYVGFTLSGIMDVPKGFANVAWFNLGPRPGEVGSSVIDGHSGYKNNKPAVFDNLYKLQKGDEIYIENSNGTIITFVVSGIKSYDSESDASSVFASNDGKSHLNLITCAGSWNEILQSHSKRLVVFTDKEIK